MAADQHQHQGMDWNPSAPASDHQMMHHYPLEAFLDEGGGAIGAALSSENSEIGATVPGSSGGTICSRVRTPFPTMPLESIQFLCAVGAGSGSGNAEPISMEAEAIKFLSEDVIMRLRALILDADRLREKGRRSKVTSNDIDSAIKMRNIEPLYNVSCLDSIPLRFSSGGGGDDYLDLETELDVSELLSMPLPKVPQEVTIRPHWLSIEGIQPAVPENPPPSSIPEQKHESVDPSEKLKIDGPTSQLVTQPRIAIPQLDSSSDKTYDKQLASHELSVEQQLYYKEITEACVGSDDNKRSEALQSLTTDPGLYEIIPRLTTFIAEGVRINVAQNNLVLLIYLMRMARALFDNTTLYLEKYIHELIPSVITCIVSRQLCVRPEVDNHWALRDFAAKLLANICKNYNTSTNNIQTRITQVFCSALMEEDTPLSSVYGAIVGLEQLGREVLKTFVVGILKPLGNRLEYAIDNSESQFDRTSATKIKYLLTRTIAPVIQKLRPPPDIIENYVEDYGYIGNVLHSTVMQLRVQEQKGQGQGSGIVRQGSFGQVDQHSQGKSM